MSVHELRSAAMRHGSAGSLTDEEVREIQKRRDGHVQGGDDDGEYEIAFSGDGAGVLTVGPWGGNTDGDPYSIQIQMGNSRMVVSGLGLGKLIKALDRRMDELAENLFAEFVEVLKAEGHRQDFSFLDLFPEEDRQELQGIMNTAVLGFAAYRRGYTD